MRLGSPRRPPSVGSGEGPAGARGGRTSSSHRRPLGLSCDPWDQPPSGSMDTSMRWSPSLSAVLSGGKVCSIQDLFPRRPSSVGRGGALPPADRPQRGGAIPSGGRSQRLGSPRRPSSVGSPPFPRRTWWWWRRASKPAKAWAARGGDRWPSPVGLMARNNYQIIVELNVSTCGADRRNCGGVNSLSPNSQAEGNLVRRLEISLIRREDRPATATRATPACETFNSSIRAARPMET